MCAQTRMKSLKQEHEKKEAKIKNYDRGIITAGALFQAAPGSVVLCFRHTETAATVSIDGGRAGFPSTTPG